MIGMHGILFGMWLILPADTFNSAASYLVMSQIAPEWVWGAVTAMIGAGVAFGALRENPVILRISSLFGMFVWAVIGMSFMVSNNVSTAAVTYPTLAAIYLFIFLRAMNEV